MKQKEIAIVHFNTPELTEAAIRSVRKHCTTDYHFTILDNSDKRPFKRRMRGVKVVNNTKGQVIDFDAELAKFPDLEVKLGERSNNGSVKHILSEQQPVKRYINMQQAYMMQRRLRRRGLAKLKIRANSSSR